MRNLYKSIILPERDSTRGIEPMVQSQHSGEGESRRARLYEGRRRKVRALVRGAATLAGLSYLVNTGRLEPFK